VPVVRCTFSPARAWRPAVVARLARTLGLTNTLAMRPRFLRTLLAAIAIGLAPGTSIAKGNTLQALNPEQKAEALSQFIAKKKFLAEGFYPGATNEADRVKFEAKVNELARRLLKLPLAEQTKARVLDQFRPTMNEFEEADSEERDRFLGYLEELMNIFGIESSDGLLNKWRYGFDPNESPESRNASALASMSLEERELLAKFKDINASTAKAALLLVLGPPTTDAGGMQIWFLKTDASSAISLSFQAGTAVFSWLAKDRFLYARRL
jgi:hypothetical protein